MLNKTFKILIFIQTILITSVLSFTKASAAEIIGVWNETSLLTHQVASQTSFITPDKIHIIAGATSVVTSKISFADINTDGSLSAWVDNSTNFPKPIYWHRSARKNDIIYVLGGAMFPPYQPLNEVYYTNASAGVLTNWFITTPLNIPLQLGGSVVSGDYIYYAGGFSNNVPDVKDNVYYTLINPDGTLGTWIETTPLPYPMYGFGMIETGYKIIIIGGLSDTVFEANINPNGTLGPWIENPVAQLPRLIHRSGITRVGNFVVSVGGVGGGTTFSDVYYSEIQTDGSLGPWTQSPNSLPTPLCCGSLAATDTHLYYTGGHNSQTGVYYETVYEAPFSEVSEGLDVPDIKQFSSPWNDDEYDTATTWSTNPSIERWGCALTSSVMTLNYHGYSTDPGALNTWLNSEPDGYIRNGLLNWLAVSRYSKTHSNSKGYSALEYKKHSANASLLSGEISNNRPGILKVPGHFVVAKGITGSDFLVNDPASNTNTLLSQVETEHGGTYSQINSYIPSTTDLSYLVFVINEGFDIHLFGHDGVEIPSDYSLEEPLTDDIDGGTASSETLGVFLFPKPENGSYEVQISGPIGNYQLDSYIYDQNGNVNMSESLGTLAGGQTDSYLINFNKTNSEDSSISEVSFNSLLSDLDEAYSNGKITKRGVYISLRVLVQTAKKSYENGRIHASKILLNVAKKELIKVTPRFIEQETADYLVFKIELLTNSL